jgi:hypothetical protein
MLSAYRTGGLTRIESVGRWLSEIARALIEAVIQERVPWMIEERLGGDDIAAARLAVQRYVRDMSLNVAMMIVVFILFVVLVLQAG